MTDLLTTLAALSDETRRALAHALVLEIEHRSEPARTGRERDDVPSDPIRTDFAAVGAGSKPARSPTTDAETDMLRPRPYTHAGEAAGSPRLSYSAPLSDAHRTSSAAVGAGSKPARSPTTDVETGGLRTRPYPRAITPAGSPTQAALTAVQPTPTDPAASLRDISDYFRQDSRRYDPGFTRY